MIAEYDITRQCFSLNIRTGASFEGINHVENINFGGPRHLQNINLYENVAPSLALNKYEI